MQLTYPLYLKTDNEKRTRQGAFSFWSMKKELTRKTLALCHFVIFCF
jgi:hypothetical protein